MTQTVIEVLGKMLIRRKIEKEGRKPQKNNGFYANA